MKGRLPETSKHRRSYKPRPYCVFGTGNDIGTTALAYRANFDVSVSVLFSNSASYLRDELVLFLERDRHHVCSCL